MNEPLQEIEFVSESSVTLYRVDANDLDVARAVWVSQDTGAHTRSEIPVALSGSSTISRNRRTSPFEHGHFTFMVDTPIFVAREFMRHRTFSFNEVSSRYTELPDRFYLPRHTGRLFTRQDRLVEPYLLSCGEINFE